MTALFALLDGSMESSKYEDECRQLMGTASYLLFTMDKLVSHCARQLQSLVSDPSTMKLFVRPCLPSFAVVYLHDCAACWA